MTTDKLIDQLARNAVNFFFDGDIEKSNACMTLLEEIQDYGFDNVKDKISVDLLQESV